MVPILLVMAGGAAGAGARYIAGNAALSAFGPDWPWGTFGVNLIGGFLMGVLVGWLARQGAGESARLLLGVGMLGGFTTFSAFSLDLVLLIERGAWLGALGYAFLSVIGSVLALFAGLGLTRAVA